MAGLSRRLLMAQVDSPPVDVSTMDGYAVRECRSRAASRPPCKIVGESFAGASLERHRCTPGDLHPDLHRRRRFPSGADRVVIQEDVAAWPRYRASSMTDPGRARHIRARGSTSRPATSLLAPGRRSRHARARRGGRGGRRRSLMCLANRDCRSSAPATSSPTLGSARDSVDPIPESVSLGVAALAAAMGRRFSRIDSLARTISGRMAIGRSNRHQGTRTSSWSPAAHRSARRTSPRPCSSRPGSELLFSKVAIKPGKPVWLGSGWRRSGRGPARQSNLRVGDRPAAPRAVARPHLRARSKRRSAGASRTARLSARANAERARPSTAPAGPAARLKFSPNQEFQQRKGPSPHADTARPLQRRHDF